MTLAHWRSVRLELSGTGEFPDGSVSRAYLLRLPLDDDGRIDADALHDAPRSATVRRYWGSDPDENGFLMQDGRNWAIFCADDLRLLRVSPQIMRAGENVSVVDVNGTVLPFRVASVL